MEMGSYFEVFIFYYFFMWEYNYMREAKKREVKTKETVFRGADKEEKDKAIYMLWTRLKSKDEADCYSSLLLFLSPYALT